MTKRFLIVLLADRRGTSASEYAFLLGCLTLAVLGALQGLADQNTLNFSYILERATAAIQGTNLP